MALPSPALCFFGLVGLLVAGAALAVQAPQHSSTNVVPLDGEPCADAPATPLFLDVTVNATRVGQEMVFLRRACGAVMAAVNDLESLRIITEGRPTVRFGDQQYLLLNSFPGLTFVVDEENQRILLEGEPWIFRPTIIDVLATPQRKPDPVAAGLFANYAYYLYGSEGTGRPLFQQNYELGFFSRYGVLLNQFAVQDPSQPQRVLRAFSTFQQDDQGLRRSIRLGDFYARAGAWGGSPALAGIQVARNFSLTPNEITTPVTTLQLALRRYAALGLNSGAFLSQAPTNSSLYFGNLGVAPYGPVEVVNVPAAYANRTLLLRSRDANGLAGLAIQQDFYGNGLLRQGLYDYSNELGISRVGYFGDRYSGLAGAFTHRYGVTQWLTVEGHGEAADKRGAIGGAVAVGVPYAGVLQATVAGSRDTASDTNGVQWSASLENVYNGFSYRFGIRRYGEGFALPGSSLLSLLQEVQDYSFSAPAPGGGQLYTAYIRQKLRPGAITTVDTGRATNLLLLGYGRPLPFGIQMNLIASRDYSVGSGTAVSLFLDFPISALWGGSQSLRGQLDATRDESGRAEATLRANQSFAAGDNTFSAQVAQGVANRDLTAIGGAWVGQKAIAGIQAIRSAGVNSYGGAVAGGFTYLDGRALFTRPLNSGFTLVRMGEDYAGVRVNSRRADAQGDVLVTDLTPYTENLLSLDPSDFPLGVQPQNLQFVAVPRTRSGVVLKPDVAPRRDVLLTVQINGDDGRRKPLPVGAYAEVEGSEEQFPVGDGGLLYLFGINDAVKVHVHYRGEDCALTLTLPPFKLPPPSPDGQPLPPTTPEIGPLLCEGIHP